MNNIETQAQVEFVENLEPDTHNHDRLSPESRLVRTADLSCTSPLNCEGSVCDRTADYYWCSPCSPSSPGQLNILKAVLFFVLFTTTRLLRASYPYFFFFFFNISTCHMYCRFHCRLICFIFKMIYRFGEMFHSVNRRCSSFHCPLSPLRMDLFRLRAQAPYSTNISTSAK